MKACVCSLNLAIFFAFLCGRGQAQTPVLPTAFATAHTAFLALAGGSGLPSKYTAVVYLSAQSALASGAHLQLSKTPEQADLSLQVSLQSELSNVSQGSSANYEYVRLAVFNAKTQVLLWVFEEPTRSGFARKSVDETMTKIVADYNALAAGKLPGA